MVEPGSSDELTARIHQKVRATIEACKADRDDPAMRRFEGDIIRLIADLGALFIALYLASMHERLDLSPWIERGFRIKTKASRRTIDTAFGTVRFARTYLHNPATGQALFPLDAVLGMPRNAASPWLIDKACRLITRMSYNATLMVFGSFAYACPSPKTLRGLTLGLGRIAPDYMDVCPLTETDGDVLVIQVDGKAPPFASKGELDKRRGPRSGNKSDNCRCRRHKGRDRRSRHKRQRRSGHSKNGKSATVVTMYTLKRSADGRLHGPINKKVWARFGPREQICQWAREQADRRGFGPDTDKTVQVLIDGEACLERYLRDRFPNAIITLDIRHAEEYVWDLARVYYPKNEQQRGWFAEPLTDMLYQGQAPTLVKKLVDELDQVPKTGPGTKAKREALAKIIGYFEARLSMMDYARWIESDLEIATGAIEGAVKHLIGERLDCSGMRWGDGAEAVMQLRCIELNGDWDDFFEWVSGSWPEQIEENGFVNISYQFPQPINQAA